MRRIGLALPLLALAATVAASEDVPKRKPGLWEMKTSIAEMGGFSPQLEMCVGDKTDDLLAQPGRHDGRCTQKTLNRSGNRLSFDAVCKIKGSTATVHAVFTGDFDTRYSGEILTTYEPPLEGMASTTMTQEGRWLGPCRAGQNPGDISIQGMAGMGGARFNLNEMMKRLPTPPAGR